MADENRLNSILCKFDADWMASDEARTEATNDLYVDRTSAHRMLRFPAKYKEQNYKKRLWTDR
ncbi:hypothetical protein D9D22_22965 [Escherichia coli]|nr:hypothetical protein PU12_18540 [Escherichia coli]MGH32983.1 hypothetical protein [Escherichia coli]